jgi:transposase
MESNLDNSSVEHGKRRKHSVAFKLKVLKELKRTPAKELAAKYDIPRAMIYHWRTTRAELLEQRSIAETSRSYHSQLSLLRRELRRVTAERDILKKAVSYFDKQSRRSASLS